MLPTPHTTSWELSLEIFNFSFRPCRQPQETIYDYMLDGRPQFEWEYLRQRWILQQDPEVLDYCAECPINIMDEMEGCKCQVENMDIFFRALNELAPESYWTRVPRNGVPTAIHEVATLLADLQEVRKGYADLTWPCAVPKFQGEPYRLEEEDEEGNLVPVGPFQFYAWNGEGPPGLLYLNEGYTVYLSRHGLMVKPTGQEPVPYLFQRIWREDLGVFGEDGNGEQIGFDVLMGRYPTWGFGQESGTELVFETRPADQVFAEIFDLLEVFCSVAHESETGILLKAPAT